MLSCHTFVARVCATVRRLARRAEATNIKLRILAVNAMPTPIEDATLYQKVGQSGNTPIFELL